MNVASSLPFVERCSCKAHNLIHFPVAFIELSFAEFLFIRIGMLRLDRLCSHCGNANSRLANLSTLPQFTAPIQHHIKRAPFAAASKENHMRKKAKVSALALLYGFLHYHFCCCLMQLVFQMDKKESVSSLKKALLILSPKCKKCGRSCQNPVDEH
jgi:hypothetical protein